MVIDEPNIFFCLFDYIIRFEFPPNFVSNYANNSQFRWSGHIPKKRRKIRIDYYILCCLQNGRFGQLCYVYKPEIMRAHCYMLGRIESIVVLKIDSA